ncbi:hypothetical protein [Streptococcus catagoni]|uniref:hypothetical protein n=1 Tax=Streptococcus catagoni TaxID=2654874 RepID=UPI00140C47FA|nr:hypothetical protein [Streptococcus catagoni]
MVKKESQIFSIRKTILGVGSVLLGVFLTTSLVAADQVTAVGPVTSTLTVEVPAGQTTSQVQPLASSSEPAKEVNSAAVGSSTELAATTPSQPSTTSTASTVDNTSPIVKETLIESPIRYVSDATQPVGYRQVQTQGTSGKLIYRSLNGQTIVERIEPTETVIVLGTKTTSQVQETLPATTEYSIDVSKPVGDNLIIAAQDGQILKITDYKIQTQSTAPVSPEVLSQAYKWTNENFYHVDQTKTQPSDRIAIDKLFVSLPPVTVDYNTKESTVREYAQFSENYIYAYVDVQNPDGSTSRKQIIRTITGEMLDPNNAELRKELGLTNDLDFYSRLLVSSREDLWTASSQDYGVDIVPTDLTTSTDDFLRYNNSNVINDALYADIKADYLRAKLAETELTRLGGLSQEQASYMEMIESQFKSLTERYNAYKDEVVTNIDYSHTSLMTAAQKTDLESRIRSLPQEVQRLINDLTIYDNEIPNMGPLTLGLANSADRSIFLQYTPNTTITNLMETILHEMTHLIDYKSGMYQESVDRNTDNTLGTVMAFSDTQEFLDVYHTYFARPDVWSYYSEKNEEAFAEGFAQYLMHRFFGSPYTKYAISPYDGQAHQTTGDGYSPFAASEYYFADLYHRLFDYPRTAEVIPYTVRTSQIAPVNGKVVYGAKPQETIVTIPYKTIYLGDPNKAYDPSGQSDLVQTGLTGQEIFRKSYSLDANNQLISKTELVSDQAAKDQIITRGIQASVSNMTLPKSVIYQEVTDDSLGQWQVLVSDMGEDGLKRMTTHYSIDPVTGQISSSMTEEVLKTMRPMIVLYRIGSSVFTKIAYQTQYLSDDSLALGSQKLVAEGKDGSSTRNLQGYHFVKAGADSHFENIVYAAESIVPAQARIIAIGTLEAKAERSMPVKERASQTVLVAKEQMPLEKKPLQVFKASKEYLPVAGDKDSFFLNLMASSLTFAFVLKLFKSKKA